MEVKYFSTEPTRMYSLISHTEWYFKLGFYTTPHEFESADPKVSLYDILLYSVTELCLGA